ncbi:MAG: hypothetical protein ACRDKT_11615 [Actinomycetota bacterium]
MADAAARVRAAVSELELPDADVVVMVSPHARRTGLYHSGSGSLRPMGIADIEVAVDADDAAIHTVARDCGLPLSDEELDHGIVVPLGLRDWAAPLVAIGIGDNAVTPEALTQITGAVQSIAQGARVLIVASVNTSAGLLPRAPLSHIPGAEDAERRLQDLLVSDVGALSTRALGIAQQGGSCAAGPLTVLGRLLEERVMVVDVHEAPVGVGYLVAHTT